MTQENELKPWFVWKPNKKIRPILKNRLSNKSILMLSDKDAQYLADKLNTRHTPSADRERALVLKDFENMVEELKDNNGDLFLKSDYGNKEHLLDKLDIQTICTALTQPVSENTEVSAINESAISDSRKSRQTENDVIGEIDCTEEDFRKWVKEQKGNCDQCSMEAFKDGFRLALAKLKELRGGE